MEFLTDYDARYWSALMAEIKNEKGVAALMGNLEGESNLIPYRLQGDYTTGYVNSINYTNGVDNGSISESTFVNDSKGYGVAQWTFYTRKQRLYKLYKSGGYDSIGNFDLSVEMLIQELTTSYITTWNALINATDIRTASDFVLHNFEQPEDQSEKVELERYTWAQGFYNRFSGSTIPTATNKMPIWMYLSERR